MSFEKRHILDLDFDIINTTIPPHLHQSQPFWTEYVEINKEKSGRVIAQSRGETLGTSNGRCLTNAIDFW